MANPCCRRTFSLLLGMLVVSSSSWVEASAADCQDTGCPNGESCCLCSCDQGDYTVGSFSCNCDKKHKPLPNEDQPECCGGQFGFDAWCLKKGSPAAHNLQCSNQTTSGTPVPDKDFYEFGTKHRCVPGQCKSGFCDNPTVPNLSEHICYDSSPSPSVKPAPSTPAPAKCQKVPKPNGCPCGHSIECESDWCTGTCEPKPAPGPAPAPAPAKNCKMSTDKPDGCPCDHSFQCKSNWCDGHCEQHSM